MRNSVNETINNRERKREYRNSITYSESYPQYVKFTECVTSCQHFRERERKENKKKTLCNNNNKADQLLLGLANSWRKQKMRKQKHHQNKI